MRVGNPAPSSAVGEAGKGVRWTHEEGLVRRKGGEEVVRARGGVRRTSKTGRVGHSKRMARK